MTLKMNYKSAYFNKLITSLRGSVEPSNALINCLHQMGFSLSREALKNCHDLTIDNFYAHEKNLGIALHPISIASITAILKSAYPVLIQSADSGDLLTLSVNKWGKFTSYHPTKNQYQSISDIDTELNIMKSWLPYSINFPFSFSYKEHLAAIFNYFKTKICLSISLGMLISSWPLLTSMLSGYLFLRINETTEHHSLAIAIPCVIFFLSFSLFTYASNMTIKSLNAKILFHAMPSIAYHLLNLPMKILKQFVSGDLVQRFFDYEAAVAMTIPITLGIVFNGFSLLILLIYMAYCNPSVACLYLGICIFFTGIKCILFPKNINYITEQFAAQGKTSSFLNEILLQIDKIRSANIEKEIFNAWLYQLLTVKILEEKSLKISNLMQTIESFMPAVLLLSFYFVLYFFKKSLDTYLLLQFIICAGQFSVIFEKLSTDLLSFMRIIPGLKRISPLLLEPPEKSDATQISSRVMSEIILSTVSLKNEKTDHLILDNISMTIKPGMFVAIIGPSGAGKSSIIRLLLGLETITSGTIKIGNDNIHHLNSRALRKQFGVVLQTTNIMPGSLFSNIAANATITLDAAWALAKCVGLDEEIRNMPMNMHTYLSDHAGFSISGGQKQKILIARALAAQPTILLLDEATSALDGKSQAIIYNHLATLNITRIVIAHRHSTIADADLIFLMDKGKLIDSGTYPSLMQRNRFLHT